MFLIHFFKFPIFHKTSGIVFISSPLLFLDIQLNYISHTPLIATHSQPGACNHVTEFYPIEHDCTYYTGLPNLPIIHTIFQRFFLYPCGSELLYPWILWCHKIEIKPLNDPYKMSSLRRDIHNGLQVSKKQTTVLSCWDFCYNN